MFRPASGWEYRWKFTLLVVSQPVFVHTGHYLLGLDGPWYSTAFTLQSAIVGTLMIAAGTLLRIWGTTTLTTDVMGSRNPDTETLISQGVYGMLRNPLYLGSLLAYAGIGAFLGAPVAMALAVFHWIRYERVIRYEEQLLQKEWGAEFDRYCRDIPRWIPRLRTLTLKVPCPNKAGLFSNGLFVGMFLGSLVAIATKQLWTLYVGELVGGAAMAMWHRSNGRTTGSTAQPQSVGAAEEPRRAA